MYIYITIHSYCPCYVYLFIYHASEGQVTVSHQLLTILKGLRQKSWKSGAVAERNPTVDLIIYLIWCLKIRNMYPQTHPNNNLDRNHADDPLDFWVPRKTHLVCNQHTRLELYSCPPPLFLDQTKHSRKLYIINRMKTI